MDRKFVLKFAGLFTITALMAVFMLFHMEQALNALSSLPGQIDKVAVANELSRNLMAQSYNMEGYMLYGDRIYFEEFRRYAGLNREQLDQLYQVVRQSRKPLVENIAKLHREYTQKCEDEIIPLVQRGDTAGAARTARGNGTASLLEEMIRLSDELGRMRLDDTCSLASQISFRAKQSIYWGGGIALIVILIGLIGSIIVNKKMALENMVYRLILLNTRNAVIVIRWDGRIYSVNRVAEDIFGFKRKEVVGKRFADVFTGLNLPGQVAFTYPVQEVMEKTRDVCNVEKVYVGAGGLRYTLLVDCLRLSDERGLAEGVMLIIRDITDRKLVEEKLRGMAVRDGMTMLYNHSYLKQSLEREIRDSAGRTASWPL